MGNADSGQDYKTEVLEELRKSQGMKMTAAEGGFDAPHTEIQEIQTERFRNQLQDDIV